MIPEDRWVDSKEAAKVTGYSTSGLAKLRVSGGGPRFSKIGRGRQAQVRYRLRDLHAWLEAHSKTSTSDVGSAA